VRTRCVCVCACVCVRACVRVCVLFLHELHVRHRHPLLLSSCEIDVKDKPP